MWSPIIAPRKEWAEPGGTIIRTTFKPHTTGVMTKKALHGWNDCRPISFLACQLQHTQIDWQLATCHLCALNLMMLSEKCRQASSIDARLGKEWDWTHYLLNKRDNVFCRVRKSSRGMQPKLIFVRVLQNNHSAPVQTGAQCKLTEALLQVLEFLRRVRQQFFHGQAVCVYELLDMSCRQILEIHRFKGFEEFPNMLHETF